MFSGKKKRNKTCDFVEEAHWPSGLIQYKAKIRYTEFQFENYDTVW